jgi:hypothetical protein
MTTIKNKVFFWISLSPLAISAVLTITILVLFRYLPGKLPLFYSLSWGDKQLATKLQFLIIPASIILITLVNLILSFQLHPSQSFFKKILLISPLIISIILTITFLKIIAIFI